MNRNIINTLTDYVEALHPIIYINHFDFKVVDEVISSVAKAGKSNVKCIEFNNALGLIDFKDKHPMKECNLEEFLKLSLEDGFEHETYIILKDIHEELKSPKIISLLRKMAENNLYNEDYSATIFIVSSITVIPKELENYITIFEIPALASEEISAVIKDFARDNEIQIEETVVDELAVSLKGLHKFQIEQILNLAYQNDGYIDKDDRQLVLKAKEQIIKKSGILEMVNFSEKIEDIGGLDNLKEWLGGKAKIFKNLDKAIKFGVDVPKGVMLIGMPGCGKSITAKVTASLFEVPLVRLDVGRLLGKYVGESEENMRKALKLAEDISPCVLWIDEIEKAFAGIDAQGSGSEVTTRLFGQFLTWMQEKESTVFIVATANDITGMPPEFLRRGRFDELFFVDLPNEKERKEILEIHWKKRKKCNQCINFVELSSKTEGFSGADLEAVVKDTIEWAFVKDRREIETADLLLTIRNTKSISVTLAEKIQKLKENLEKRKIKSASK